MPNFEHAHGTVIIGQGEIDRLIELAKHDPQHKYRLCANPTASDAISEMIIVHLSDTVVPIHRHNGKSESFTFLEGYADVELYSDDGRLVQTIPMAPPGAYGRNCFYRLNSDTYHTLKILSPVVVFHEVTNGPWAKEDLIVAPFWQAPKGWHR